MSRPCTVCGEQHNRRSGRTPLRTCKPECARTAYIRARGPNYTGHVPSFEERVTPGLVGEAVSLPDAFDAQPRGSLWRLRDEPPPVWSTP